MCLCQRNGKTITIFSHEKKYAEVLDILDQQEKSTEEIYSAAGLCSPESVSYPDANPAIASSSRPDQPAAHFPPTASESDALHGVKIPCYGDQLTRVRFAGPSLSFLHC